MNAMAVTRAIQSGRLVKCVIRDANNNPKITDFEVADREWAENTDLTRAHTDVKAKAAARAVGLPEAKEETREEHATINDATAKEKFWRAKLAEMKFKEAAKELIPASELRRVMVDVFAEVKTKLLGIPSRARQQDPALTVAQVMLIEALVREALEALANETAERE